MVALFVVITFIAFIVISSLLQRKEVTDSNEAVASSSMRAGLPFPKGYFFSPNHTWLSLESSGKVTIGIDELIQKFVGKIKSIKMKNSGDYIMKGEELAVINKEGVDISIVSPISGKIECANFEIDQDPQKLKTDPYQTCWMYSVEPTNLSDDIKYFKIAEQAKNWLANEFSRLKDFALSHQMQPALMQSTLADGGTLADGISDYLDPEAIGEFKKQFLMNLNEDE